jgi:hypothetical protein
MSSEAALTAAADRDDVLDWLLLTDDDEDYPVTTAFRMRL